uniref:ORF2 n=1 Tax=Torque teno Leptonychotes weddellii virus-1 TaxID=2012676 RepID=A0A1Z2RV81_9VIRU|nr:ORF2 [Torque teno Leptonychotes weddellii virus 1]
MAGAPIIGRSDVPDLAHPLKFRQAEARWKRAVSVAHQAFCLCGNFLSHFKWCSEKEDGGNPEGADGGASAANTTGEGDITGHTSGEEDITDLELLQ